MPHITVEHSADISSSEVLQSLPKIQKIIASIPEGNFALEACKARAIPFEKYFVGSKSHEEASFFHVTIKILSGRSEQIKQQLAQKIGDFAVEFVAKNSTKKLRVDVSVDVVDMERGVYFKKEIP